MLVRHLSKGRERGGMSKLFKLKKWLTIQEAARHLAISFGEEVSEADVLRLGLDGHLKLSVNFVNRASACRGKMVAFSEAKKVPGIPRDKHGKPCEPYDVILGLVTFVKLPDGQIEKRVVQFDEKIVSIEGVWDLSMFGGEHLDVEHKYQMLSNGVEITLVNIDGVYLWGTDGELWRLQTAHEEIDFIHGSLAQLEKLKQQIANDNIGAAEAEKIMKKYKDERTEFLENIKSRPESESYFPSGGLPADSVLVVRTDALREFEETLNNTASTTEKPLSSTERNTLLTIIAALCDHTRINYTDHGTGAQFARMTEKIGAPVDQDTINKKLKLIQNALETRMK